MRKPSAGTHRGRSSSHSARWSTHDHLTHAPPPRRHEPAPDRARPPAGPATSSAVGVNALLLYLLNRNPGWQAVPFLTDAMNRVIGVVNLRSRRAWSPTSSTSCGTPTWLKALGDLATTCAGVLAMLRIWQVWPFDFPAGSPWNLLAHGSLGLGLVGGAIGIVESTVRYVRAIGFSSA